MNPMNTIAQLRVNGRPVSLSTGIPSFSTSGNLQAHPTVSLYVTTPDIGEVEFPVTTPSIGKCDDRWTSAWNRPYRSGDKNRFDRFMSKHPSIKWGELSSPHLHWVEDQDYTHLLMDARSRNLIGVRLYASKFQRPVWGTLKQGFSVTQAEFQSQEWEEGKIMHQYYWAMLEELGDRKLWTCLHPAPVNEDGVALWAFDGKTSVALPRVGDDWGLSFELVIEKEIEEMDPYHPYAVDLIA